MRIQATDYFETAQERLVDAQLLYDNKRYALSLYISGLAVECLLRAFRLLKDPHFDARHDLTELLGVSELELIVPIKYRHEIIEATGIIFTRWKNDIRFASGNRLRRHFKRLKLDRGIRGDFLKENCRIALQAATTIIRIGGSRWHA
jgi:hypothetical protein